MPEMSIPEYVVSEINRLRAEKLRIEGAIAALETLARSMTPVSTPEAPAELEQKRGKRRT